MKQPLPLPCPLILASQSPRRKEIVQGAGFSFTQVIKPVVEEFPSNIPVTEVALHIAQNKMSVFMDECELNLVLTADTVVILEGEILGKPVNELDAISMLTRLSGKAHTVITGYCLRFKDHVEEAAVESIVHFRDMTPDEMKYYVKNYKPMDKAGSYGIQDWLGLTVVRAIEGSYYNVMGLPMYEVYQSMKKFC